MFSLSNAPLLSDLGRAALIRYIAERSPEKIGSRYCRTVWGIQMSQALIIGDNMAVSRAIQDQLAGCGFDSFGHAWTERQALDAPERRHPDLIVVGDHIACGSPLELVRQLASRTDADFLAITVDSCSFGRSLPDNAQVDGPYPLNELQEAITSARGTT